MECELVLSARQATSTERVPNAVYPVVVDKQMAALLANTDFQRNIRRYNAAVSFVSFADTGGNAARHLPGRGPYTYAVQGQVYHSMSSLDPPDGQARLYGQLHFYAPDEALDKRLSISMGLIGVSYRVCKRYCITMCAAHQIKQ